MRLHLLERRPLTGRPDFVALRLECVALFREDAIHFALLGVVEIQQHRQLVDIHEGRPVRLCGGECADEQEDRDQSRSQFLHRGDLHSVCVRSTVRSGRVA